MEHPFITNISDVEHCIGEFPIMRVDRGDGLIIFNYAVSFNALFAITEDMSEDEKHLALLRRECRGIAFDKETGEIVSRPYHKFFNIGEKWDTLPDALPLGQPHCRVEKLDGSMVHVCYHDGEIKFLTRSGVTQTSKEALDYYQKVRTPESDSWLKSVCQAGFTPIFEFESMNNTIVLIHKENRLVLTNIRERDTGIYLHDAFPDDFAPPVPFHTLKRDWTPITDIHAYVQEIRDVKGREGEVVCFTDTDFFVKMKGDEYTALHHVVTNDFKGRHLLSAVIYETADDIIPKFDPARLPIVTGYADEFTLFIQKMIDRCKEVGNDARSITDERRRFEYVSLVMKDQPHFIQTAMHYSRSQSHDVEFGVKFTITKQATFADNRYRAFTEKYDLKVPNFMF